MAFAHDWRSSHRDREVDVVAGLPSSKLERVSWMDGFDEPGLHCRESRDGRVAEHLHKQTPHEAVGAHAVQDGPVEAAP